MSVSTEARVRLAGSSVAVAATALALAVLVVPFEVVTTIDAGVRLGSPPRSWFYTSLTVGPLALTWGLWMASTGRLRPLTTRRALVAPVVSAVLWVLTNLRFAYVLHARGPYEGGVGSPFDPGLWEGFTWYAEVPAAYLPILVCAFLALGPLLAASRYRQVVGYAGSLLAVGALVVVSIGGFDVLDLVLQVGTLAIAGSAVLLAGAFLSSHAAAPASSDGAVADVPFLGPVLERFEAGSERGAPVSADDTSASSVPEPASPSVVSLLGSGSVLSGLVLMGLLPALHLDAWWDLLGGEHLALAVASVLVGPILFVWGVATVWEDDPQSLTVLRAAVAPFLAAVPALLYAAWRPLPSAVGGEWYEPDSTSRTVGEVVATAASVLDGTVFVAVALLPAGVVLARRARTRHVSRAELGLAAGLPTLLLGAVVSVRGLASIAAARIALAGAALGVVAVGVGYGAARIDRSSALGPETRDATEAGTVTAADRRSDIEDETDEAPE